MSSFKIGDVVYLKSGSEPMTVTEVDDDSREIFVTWWHNGSLSDEVSIPVECLIAGTWAPGPF